MRLKGISKKIVAYVCAAALAVTSFAVPTVFAADETLPDVVLDGGEEGGSSMIGTFTPPTKRGQATDDYKYLGYASFLDMVPDDLMPGAGNYNYLVMTYTGDITQLRLEFNRLLWNDDGTPMLDSAGAQMQELAKPIWFNPEGQTNYFVTADGSDIPLVGDNTTIVIDLAKTVSEDSMSEDGLGAPIDYFNTGAHMHCDMMVTYGDGNGITISDAYFTMNLPAPEPETTTEAPVETTEAPVETTEAPVETTEAPVETTEAPVETTEAPVETTAPEVTTEAPTLPDVIVLDEGDNGAFVGHTLASDADGYSYGGYVYLKGATAEYKYLQLTYTGSLANTRFEIMGDNTYWFDTWQAVKFVDMNGNDIDTSYSDKERTIVIDLEKSGAELGWGEGLHIHTENLATNGGVTFIDGRVSKVAPELPEVPEYTVSVDGEEVATVEEDGTYTLPTDANVGYYADGKLYAPGAEYTVVADVAFTSVNVAIDNAASLRLIDPTGIRFRASITAEEAAFDSVIKSEGMLIAPADVYNENGSLALDSTFVKVNVVNDGWYNGVQGTYCGSLANIKSANYGREFVAKAYVTVEYADGTTSTVYSTTTGAKSIAGIATAIQANAAYNNLSTAQKTLVDTFAAAVK